MLGLGSSPSPWLLARNTMREAMADSCFAALSPRAARVALGLFAAMTLLSVGITFSPLKSGFADAPHRGPGDLALYQAEVRRIRAGQDYYRAADIELRRRGYPTRSLFNWRTPLPMWLVGQVQPWIGRLLAGGLALAAIYAALLALEREGHVWQGVGCGVLMIGALLPSLMENIYIAPELWSAALITLSLSAYAHQRTSSAVAFGVAALCFRDLAGLYCLAMALTALAQRRWREVAGWFAGLMFYAAFFAWHAAHVLRWIGPDDVAHTGSWLQWGGLPFVISTAQMNAYLLLLPQWVTAVYLPMALVGIAGWNTVAGQRVGIAACAYLTLFAAVGHPFNQYWGTLIAPLLCFGVARFPASLVALWNKARQPSFDAPAATVG